jgi:hypothetical protein
MISSLVYLMCAMTSILCTTLLYLSYRKTKAKLLLWSVICFLCLAINNILLFADLVIVPNIDLAVIRTVPAVIGFAALIWGFIWDIQ